MLTSVQISVLGATAEVLEPPFVKTIRIKRACGHTGGVILSPFRRKI